MLLEPLLVLAAQVDFQHDSLDLAAAFTELGVDEAIDAKDVRVVLQFPLARDAGVEGLAVVVAAVPRLVLWLAAVGFENAQTSLGQHVGVLACADLDGLDQAFIAQVTEAALGVVEVRQVPLGDHTKRADGRQHEAVVAIQLVQVLAFVLDELAFVVARQFQALYKRLARVTVLRVSIAVEIPLTVIRVARVVAPAQLLDRQFVALACVDITRVEIHVGANLFLEV